MKKTLILFDTLYNEYRYQELWDPDNNIFIFEVSNLLECPEDAIIGRALRDANDATNITKYFKNTLNIDDFYSELLTYWIH